MVIACVLGGQNGRTVSLEQLGIQRQPSGVKVVLFTARGEAALHGDPPDQAAGYVP
jgi:hypothetical protein